MDRRQFLGLGAVTALSPAPVELPQRQASTDLLSMLAPKWAGPVTITVEGLTAEHDRVYANCCATGIQVHYSQPARRLSANQFLFRAPLGTIEADWLVLPREALAAISDIGRYCTLSWRCQPEDTMEMVAERVALCSCQSCRVFTADPACYCLVRPRLVMTDYSVRHPGDSHGGRHPIFGQHPLSGRCVDRAI